MTVPPTSLYHVLGAAPAASADELRRAYLAQARRLHPDAGGDSAAMTRLNEAWTVLSDPVRRRQYDLELGVARVGDDGAEAVPAAADADADPDLLDDRPLSAPPQGGALPFIPPALFALSIVVGCVGLAVDAPPVLAAAGALFFLSCVAVAAVSMWTLRASTRR